MRAASCAALLDAIGPALCNGPDRTGILPDTQAYEANQRKHAPVPMIQKLNAPVAPPLRIAAGLLAIILSAACLATDDFDLAPKHTALADADYELMSAVLKHGLDQSAKQLVIADTTTAPTLPKASAAVIEQRAADLGTTPELVRAWTELSAEHTALTRAFNLPIQYTLLTESARDLLFRGDNPAAGWKLFYARFDGSPGLIRVSRPAYNLAHQEALMYVEFECGETCGSGTLVKAVRDPKHLWQVTGGLVLWLADAQKEPKK